MQTSATGRQRRHKASVKGGVAESVERLQAAAKEAEAWQINKEVDHRR